MNCSDFRRLYTTDPRDPDPALNAHCRACPACEEYAVRVDRFEALLGRAVAVDLPEAAIPRVPGAVAGDARPPMFGPAAPAGLAQRVQSRWTASMRMPWWHCLSLSAAAALALALMVGVAVWTGSAGGSFERGLMAHIREDADALRGSASVSPRRLAVVLASAGLSLAGNLGTVTFAGFCLVQGRWGAHLVVAGAHGPVTVIILPGDSEAGGAFEAGSYHGLVVLAARGSISLVSHRRDDLPPMAARVQQAVRWKL